MLNSFEAVRAEALFVSTLQCSDQPGAAQVRDAVAATLRRLGIKGCAEEVAHEFGDHPDCAVGRMAWALATVRASYPPRMSRTPRVNGQKRAVGALKLAG
jgi:hypothetical protein